MALYSCFRCMKTFEDTRAEALACPYCHARVQLRTGPRPFTVSTKRLLVIHEGRVYAERPRPNPALRRRNSLSKTLENYQRERADLLGKPGIGMQLGELRQRHPSNGEGTLHDVSSMDVYPLILAELVEALGPDRFVLYGSGSLWLEGNPRPQKQVRIKDLDMAVLCKGSREELAEFIKQTVARTCAASSIDMEDNSKVYLTKGNTLEFISPHENLQFSFNLQSPSEYAKTFRLARPVEIFTGVRVLVAGLDFITHRLFGGDALIATRLFRADKTRQVLMYAAMALGYKKALLEDIVNELLDRTIRLAPDKLIQQLRAVGKNAYDGSKTEFHDRTLAIVEKFERERQAVQALREPINLQMQQGRKRLLTTMNKQMELILSKEEFQGAQREVNQEMAERWRRFMAPQKDRVETTAKLRMEEAVRQLHADVLEFLRECLDDVDKQLLLADWLRFDQLVKIKQGKERLAEALGGGHKPKVGSPLSKTLRTSSNTISSRTQGNGVS